jgi:hypothetical protein
MLYSFRTRAFAAALGAAFATAAGAQTLIGHRAPNGVAWLSGGVSLEERDALRDVAPDYNLRVVVATSGRGEYRADVPVTVEDRDGNPVLNVVTDGPWLFARVAPGRYRVRTGDGQEQTVEVRSDATASVYFHAPAE